LAVAEAARYEAVRQIKELGATNIIIRSVKPPRNPQQTEEVLSYGLTHEDLERIAETIPTVVSVTPLREFRKEARHLEHKLEARVVGVMPSYQSMNGLRLNKGRFLSAIDNERLSNVCVLAAESASILFPLEDPLGQAVRVGEQHFYQVVGVTETRASSAGIGSSFAAQDYNRDVYIPFATDSVRFGKVLMYEGAGTFEAERLEMSQMTVAVDDTAHVRETAKIIEGLLKQFHKKEDISLTVPEASAL
jgi:putative ABC transport system permease protein